MKYYSLIILILLVTFSTSGVLNAETAESLNQKIQEKQDLIKQLEKDAVKYEKQIAETLKEKTTLQNTLNSLNLTQKKLSTDIKITQSNISSTNSTIEAIGNQIETKAEQIEKSKQAISKNIRSISGYEDYSMIEILMSKESVSDVLDHAKTLITLNTSVQNKINDLRGVTLSLEQDKNEKEKKKQSLVVAQKTLSAQKQSVVSAANEQTSLLKQTQSKESNYKKLLADNEAKRKAFEAELFNFEQQLKITLDPKSFVQAKSGILNWPLSKVVITQYFGRTVDAKRLYVSGSHNGMDFGTSIGTPVLAAMSGSVTATGNTDLQASCYSYGKWVLIKHDNGLSTIYAHLSSIMVNPGDSVSIGQTIALSGNTGYSTGPHLHFGVFATQGMRVQQYTSSIGCKSMIIPIADKSAYLDPLVYLPK